MLLLFFVLAFWLLGAKCNIEKSISKVWDELQPQVQEIKYVLVLFTSGGGKVEKDIDRWIGA